MIWRVDWRKKIYSSMKTETCEKFGRSGTQGFWRLHCSDPIRSRLVSRKLLMAYSNSGFHAEHEYVFFKLNGLCLESQNHILWKTMEKVVFFRSQKCFGFFGPKTASRNVLNEIFVIAVICSIEWCIEKWKINFARILHWMYLKCQKLRFLIILTKNKNLFDHMIKFNKKKKTKFISIIFFFCDPSN